MQRPVEWGKAMRRRSYQITEDTRRKSRMSGEQLKRRLVTEAVSTEAELERLRRLRIGMEARLDRYSGEQARLRSQRLLRDMDAGAPPAAAKHHQQQQQRQHQAAAADEAGNDAAENSEDDADLTEWEAALLSQFVARQRAQDAAATGGDAKPPTAAPVSIDGLSLEKFLRRCESRRLMDGAIRRLNDLVDSWHPEPPSGEAAAAADSGWRFRAVRLRASDRPAAPAKRNPPRPPPPPPPADEAVAAADAPPPAELIGRIERDFRSLLAEARKARYLRGRNPEILERDRELTTEEIFTMVT